MLGELDGNDRIVISDMEAGLGTLSRIARGGLDLVLVVAEPSAKGIDIARRAAQIAANRAPVIIVANKVGGPEDLDAVRAVLGDRELVAIPDEPAITLAERDGLAPIDVDPEAPGVRALTELADQVAAYRSES